MKKPKVLWMTLILVLALSACSAGISASASSSSTGQSVASSAAQTTSSPTAAAGTSTGTSTGTSAGTSAASTSVDGANSPTHEDASDYVYDQAAVIPIRLGGDTASADNVGVRVEGSTVTISAAGTYSLSGSLSDGQIVVNSVNKGVVRLVLDGVDLHNSSGAPIYVVDADKVVILLAEGSANTVSDGQTYAVGGDATDEPNAAIFSMADLSISGSGSLNVTGNYQDGIASKDGLVIAGGTITVQAADDGIRGKDYLVVEGGSLTVNSQGDGLKSDNETDAAKGYIQVAGGTIQVNSGGDGLAAQTDVNITGGEFSITSGGGSGSQTDGSTSTKGIKGQVSVLIEGGTFTIDAADDAIHSNGSVTINNGALQLASGDDGIHADATLTVNGGDIRISQSYEGIESAVITLNAGTIHILASDDGVNGASGVDGSGGNPPMRPGSPQQDTFTYTGDVYLYIHGGYLYVDANGDGIDINGAIEMSDGVVVVNGPTEQMNGAIDYDAGFTMTGGYIVAAGSSGMAMTTGQTSGQPSVLVYLTATQPAGTLVHIQNSAGEDVLTFAPTKAFQSIAFSSSGLVQGETYTVFTGGSSSGTVVDGLYQGGSYSGGTENSSFAPAGVVTTVGTGGRMGPRR